MSAEWIDVKFKDICINKNIVTKNPDDDGLEYYVGLEHLEPEELKIPSWGLISEGTTFTRVFSPGQVLFGKRRSYQKKAALAEFTGVCSGDILVFEADEDLINPELLPYIVQNEAFFDYTVGTSSGSLSPRTSWKHLSEYQLRIPKEKDMQDKIISQLKKLENAIENKKRLIQTTELYKSKLMQQVLTQGVGHKSFKKSELGEIPLKWDVVPLVKVMEAGAKGIKRGPFGGSLKKSFFVPEGYAVYEQQHVINNNYSNVRYFINEEKYQELKAFETFEDDILISCSGTVGRISLVPKGIKPGIMNQALLRFRVDKSIISPIFLLYLLSSDTMQSKLLDMTQGSTIKNIVAVSEIKKITIALPPLEEQNKIVEIFSILDQQIENFQKEYLQLKGINKAFLFQLF